jgi:hypothetical protein
MTLNEHIANGPVWVFAWVMWMGIINIAAILFLITRKDGKFRFGHFEALAIIATMVVMALFMAWLFDQVGYVRLLGLPHVLFWTPLAIYLWTRLSHHPRNSVFGVYLRVLLATIGISLVIDYIDVVRYLTGDGALS